MNVSFCLLQAMYCMGWAGVMQAFLVPLYHSYGYSAFAISLFTAASSAGAILMKPVLGFLSDRAKSTRQVILSALIVGVGASLLLALGRRHMLLTMLSSMLLYATTGSLSTLIDVWSARLEQRGARVNFGFARSCGSFSYALFVIVFGRLLDTVGYGILIPTFIGFSVLSVAAALSVREPPRSPALGTADGAPGRMRTGEAIRAIVHSRPFCKLMAAVFLVYLASYSITVFLPLRMRELGGSNMLYGVALFCSGISEVGALLLYRRIASRLRHGNMLLTAFVLSIGALALVGFARSNAVVILGMFCQGVFTGFYIAGIAFSVSGILGGELAYTGSMLTASCMSLATVAAGLYMGAMTERLSLAAAMRTAPLFAVLGVIVYLWPSIEERAYLSARWRSHSRYRGA